MRVGCLLVAVAAACGRLGFDAPPDDANPIVESPPPPALACGQTVATGSNILGSALEATATAHGVAALWIDPAGALFGATWQAAPGGVNVVRGAVALAPGPFTRLWVAAHDDQLLVAAQGASSGSARVLRDDLTPVGPAMTVDIPPSVGRDPIARRRDGPGFVGITIGPDQPAIYRFDDSSPSMIRLYPELMFHTSPSIAADASGYAIVTELADQFGPGCWYSRLTDDFNLVAGPGSLESTQQADCDSSTVTSTAGPAGAGMAWMDRDPVNSYVEFRGTTAQGGVASPSGETGVNSPLITGTSTGFAVIYRSTAGLRVHDTSGTRTLSASASLADLVTWGDRAIVLWTTANGALQLTRLCP